MTEILINDELLVDLVQKYPFLYDKKHHLFKDKLAKENAWDMIASILGGTRENVESRWNVLRNRYNTEKRKEKSIPSGSAGSYKSFWPFYKVMGFLDQHIVCRRTYGNVIDVNKETSHGASPWNSMSTICRPQQEELSISLTDESEQQDSDYLEHNETVVPQECSSTETVHRFPVKHGEQQRALTSKIKQIRASNKENKPNLSKVIENTFTNLQTYLHSDEEIVNEDTLFGKTVGETLRMCKDKQKKAIVKVKIFQDLAELEDINFDK